MIDRLGSKKLFIYIIIGIALFSDLFSLVSLIINGISAAYDVIMIIITVIDSLMLLLFRFTNPRVKSTVKFYILYALVLSILYIIFSNVVTSYMWKTSILVFILSHVISLISVITVCFASKDSAKYIDMKKINASIAFSGVVTLFYVVFIFIFGFYGQGLTNRELIYEYNEFNDTYSVVDITKGSSSKVIIPSEFNGKNVGSVNAAIFSDSKVKTVIFEKLSEDINFRNVSTFTISNALKTVEASKEDIDYIRDIFYEFPYTDSSIAFANAITPNDISDDEVYVNIDYDMETIEALGGKPLSTWIRPKGTVFNVNYDGEVEYSKHSDVTSAVDLKWNYDNNNKRIFTGVLNIIDDINNTAIEKSVDNAYISFKKIYKVTVGDDNDFIYEIPESLKHDTISGVSAGCKYLLYEQADEYFASLNNREDFKLAFNVGGRNYTKFSEYLSTANQAVSVSPIWTMNPITLTDLSIDLENSNLTEGEVTYGNKVVLKSELAGVPEGFTTTYEWYRGSEKISNALSTLTLNSINPTDAGTYLLTATKSIASSSIKVTSEKTLIVTVAAKKLHFTWSYPSSDVYEGANKQLSASYVTSDILNNDAVTFTINNNGLCKDAGSYDFDVTLDNNWTKYYEAKDNTKSYTIKKKDASLVWDASEYTYDGEQHQPKVVNITGYIVSDGEATLIDLIKYSGAKLTNAGSTTSTVTADVTSLKNYNITNTQQIFKINQREITVTGWDKETFVYNGLNQVPVVTSLNNVVVGEDATVLTAITYTTGTSKNVANYTRTATLPASSNYKIIDGGQKVFNYSITKADLTVIADDKTITYGDAIPNYTVSYDGFVNGETKNVLGGTLSFACSYVVGSGVNTYVITPSGYTSNNYNIEYKPGTLTVNKKALTISADNKTITYGDAAPTYTYQTNGLISLDTVASLTGTIALTCSYAQGNQAGPYTIQIGGATSNNYEITYQPGTLTVNKKTLNVSADNKSVTYGDPTPIYTYVTDGFVLGEGVSNLSGSITLTCKYSAKSKVDTYTITPSGFTSNNYVFAYTNGILTVNKKDLTVTVQNKELTYGDTFTASTVIYNGFIEGESSSDLGGTLAYSSSYHVGSNVGSYDITASGLTSNNYNITYEKGTLNIVKADLGVIAEDKSVSYGASIPTYTVTIKGFKANDTVSSLGGAINYGCSYAPTSTVGSYTITPSGYTSGNYNIQYENGNVYVSKASLTITMNSYTITYGDDAPLYDVSYNGFKNGETASVLAGSLSFDCDYVVGSDAKNYAIKAEGYTSSNYAITYKAGTLTVQKAALTVNVNDKTITYGENEGAYSCTFNGFVLGQTESVLTGTLATSTSYTSNKAAGEYNVNASGYSSANYAISYNTAKLTVNKAHLSITIGAKEIKYGDSLDNVYTINVTGLVNNDTTSAIQNACTFSCTYTLGSNVGSYDITITAMNNNNYDYQVTNGTLTVQKAALTVTANSYQITYGDAAPVYQASYNGFKNNDTAASLGGSLNLTCTYVAGNNVGPYTITASGYTSDNYEISYQDGKLSVSKKALTITVNNQTIHAGETPTFTVSYSGFVQGEDESVLTGTLSYTCSYETTSPAGSYEVTVSGLSATNYEITYQKGILTVE